MSKQDKQIEKTAREWCRVRGYTYQKHTFDAETGATTVEAKDNKGNRVRGMIANKDLAKGKAPAKPKAAKGGK